MGKGKTLPFPLHDSLAMKCFDIVHSDVWGIAPVIPHSHYKYFVTFIDDYSRFTWIYFLHAKSDVFSVFEVFLSYVENQFSTTIKILRSDSGGSMFLRNFKHFYNPKASSLNDLVLTPPNKMVCLSGKTDISWILLVHFC